LNVYGTVRIHDPKLNNAILPSLFAGGAAFLVRRSWIDKLGYLFDDSFITGAEDLDLSVRTILSGGKIGYVVSSQVVHHAGTTRKFYRTELAYLATRNELIAYFKALSLSSFAKILTVRFIYIASRIVGRSVEIRRNLGMFAGLIAGLLYTPLYFEKRRKFHRLKSVSDRFLLMNLKFNSSSPLGRLIWVFLNGSGARPVAHK
jgi:GT2 family glycosyltransferase